MLVVCPFSAKNIYFARQIALKTQRTTARVKNRMQSVKLKQLAWFIPAIY